jgi:ABC-type xylose transport system permease subunit
MGINTGQCASECYVWFDFAFAGGLQFSLRISGRVRGKEILNTLASVFLGGTSVFGGVGTILGTFLGAYHRRHRAATVAVGLTGFWTQLIYGLIIVLGHHAHLPAQAAGFKPPLANRSSICILNTDLAESPASISASV